MFTSLFMRCFLLLALLLNGLAAAHAVQIPSIAPVQKAEPAVAHEDCHDMAMQGHDASAQAMSPVSESPAHQHADCCKGGVCQCVCAAQASTTDTALLISPAPSSRLQTSLPTIYRSVDLALILRPPIA